MGDVREAVRARYAGIARGASPPTAADGVARAIGYDAGDLAAVPDGANLGLGCGNPLALASLRPGDVVLDLGSGAGFDALLAARVVGATGRVIGVDMTQEMVEKAQANAAKIGLDNVEFRIGVIEKLPLESASVDVVISNCVINLSPEKQRVFAEAFRVLRPGGRLMVSDLVTLGELPTSVRASVAAYVGCIAGVSLKEDYLRWLAAVGFERIEVASEKQAAEILGAAVLGSEACPCSDPALSTVADGLLREVPLDDLKEAARLVMSVRIAARKPG